PLGDVYAMSLGATPAWTKLTPGGTPPAARFAGAVIMDPARSRMVISGGTDFDQYFGDTFALTFSGATGATWTMLSIPGAPSARSDHKAVYDPIGDRLVFFGGQNLGGLLHETWALDFVNPVDVPDPVALPA